MARYSAQPDKEIRDIVADLFVGLHIQDKGDAVATANEYVKVLEGISEDAVREAVDDYRRGIQGDGIFAPKPPQLAQHARKVQTEQRLRSQEFKPIDFQKPKFLQELEAGKFERPDKESLKREIEERASRQLTRTRSKPHGCV